MNSDGDLEELEEIIEEAIKEVIASTIRIFYIHPNLAAKTDFNRLPEDCYFILSNLVDEDKAYEILDFKLKTSMLDFISKNRDKVMRERESNGR